jgi:hypothetical protein
MTGTRRVPRGPLWSGIVVVALLAACEVADLPTAPDMPAESKASLNDRSQPKVDLCHLNEDGQYVPITVALPAAIKAHLNHGDEYRGGDVLDENCEPRVAEVGGFLVPGNVDMVSTRDGWSVRCLAWSGRVCTHAQVKVECTTCEPYGQCGEWHDLTNFNNLNHPTTRTFCAIASGSAAFSQVGNGAPATGGGACGWSSWSHPLCTASQATVHTAGFGIPANHGITVHESYCAADRLIVECSDW